MRLVHIPSGWRIFVVEGQKDNPYATFEECKNGNVYEKFYNFDKARLKIEELTNKIAGAKKKIVNNPIVMTVYSSTCPDLTMIDLPGITRISVEDQGMDVEKITKGMAISYF